MDLTSTESTTQKPEIFLRDPKEIPEVTDFLNSVLNQFKSFDYSIKKRFDTDKLFEFLTQELPMSSFQLGRELFINELVNLSELFFDLTKTKNIKIQIQVIHTDMCRLFHVDNIRQRLLCTYIGPGTEWLDSSNVFRDGLGKGCNDKIVKDYEKINRAKPFEVLLLKGAKYGKSELSTVHRSPPIEKESKTRILFKIDECRSI